MTSRSARTCTCPARCGCGPRREACGTSPSTLAAGAQENAAAWAKLPPLEGANRFTGVKPGATDPGRGRRQGRPAAAGQPGIRQRPRDRLRRRFDLAVVHAGLRIGPQAILAADRALAGPQGPDGPGRRLGAAGQHAVLPRQSRRVHRRGPVAAERADRRRRIQGRDRQARQQADARRDDPQGRADGRFVPRDATARRLHDRGHGDAAGRAAGHGADPIHRLAAGPRIGQRLGRSRQP